jgi:hypothetical protein
MEERRKTPKFDMGSLAPKARTPSLSLRTTLHDSEDLGNDKHLTGSRKPSSTKASKKRSGDPLDSSLPESLRVVVGSDGSFKFSMNPLLLAPKIARPVLVIHPEVLSKYMTCKAFLLLVRRGNIISARSTSPLPMLCRQQKLLLQ